MRIKGPARRLRRLLGVAENLLLRASGPFARPPDTAVEELFRSLTAAQREEVCFAWDYRCPRRGLLRTFVANHWQVTRPCIRGGFFTRGQERLIHDVFRGIVDPAWYPRFLKQLADDTYGHPFGADQSIAFFGRPGGGPFQFLITGRHLTMRADANRDGEVAFGGPLLYGHAASGFHEKPGHPGNVFWPQAAAASRVYWLLDADQRKRARVAHRPEETAIGFTAGGRPGLPAGELADEQRTALARVLDSLTAPFRARDRSWVERCLARQGGLDACTLAFYEEGQTSSDHWDNWRLEGPGFVWHFRGTPHVHAWVHVASDATSTVDARSGAFLFPNHDPLR
jgi:hypothetical protein